MRYATIKKNDIANGEGVCVSLFVQGCANRCKGCFNPETWDFNGGQKFTFDTRNEILEALDANGVHRNFCILGGEPLDPVNRLQILNIINFIKELRPSTKIYLWTGYYINNLIEEKDSCIKYILSSIDVLIDGPYVEEERDLTLVMRGSRNQTIYNKEELEKILNDKQF